MLHKAAHCREQAEDDQHQRHHKTHVAAGDAGQLDHAVVLAEAGVREGIEYRRNKRVQAVRQHAAFQALHVQRAGHRLLGDVGGSGDIADGLQRGDHKDQHQRQEQTPVNAQTVVQRRGDGDQRAVGRCGVLRQHAQRPRQQITGCHGDHQRSHAQVRVTLAVQQNNDRQHDARQQQVFRRAEGMVAHCGIAAADGGEADLNQRQADNHHHHAGDQRGNDAARQMQHAGDDHLRAACQHQGAEQRRHHGRDIRTAGFQGCAAHDQRCHEVKAGTLDRQ